MMLSKLTHVTEESILLLMIVVFFFLLFRCDGRSFGYTCLPRAVDRERRIFSMPAYYLRLDSIRLMSK